MFVLLVTMFFATSVTRSYASNANTTLSTFDVTINGEKINNEYRKYPLLVYKGITYFPMTYHDAMFLGLETKWDSKNGLEIMKESVPTFYPYEKYLQTKKNAASYKAAVPTFKVKVNSKVVDNSKEKYPLLVFRDVTYVPLTWQFAVDEFGWSYKFSKEAGLEITAKNYPPANGPTYPMIEEKVFIDGSNNIKIQAYRHRMPSAGNLTISVNGEDFKQLGSPDYIYGFNGPFDSNSIGLSPNNFMEFKENWLYIKAAKENWIEGHIYKIYKVNIVTGETVLAE